MFAPSEHITDLEDRIIGYCGLKKYQTKSDLWVGFGCVADAPGWVHAMVVLKDPWCYDEDLEVLVAEGLPPLQKAQDED